MEYTVSYVDKLNALNELKKLIITELDLAYDKRQNILLSCSNDGCNRISYCSCDCNDGW